jgi:hypothetical protein
MYLIALSSDYPLKIVKSEEVTPSTHFKIGTSLTNKVLLSYTTQFSVKKINNWEITMFHILNLPQFHNGNFIIENLDMQKDIDYHTKEEVNLMDKNLNHRVVTFSTNHVLNGFINYTYTPEGILINHAHTCVEMRFQGLFFTLLNEVIEQAKFDSIPKITINTTYLLVSAVLLEKIKKHIEKFDIEVIVNVYEDFTKTAC